MDEERELFVSKVVKCNETEELLALVGGAVAQMYLSTSTGKIDFDSLCADIDLGSKKVSRSLVFLKRGSPYRGHRTLPKSFPGLQAKVNKRSADTVCA